MNLYFFLSLRSKLKEYKRIIFFLFFIVDLLKCCIHTIYLMGWNFFRFFIVRIFVLLKGSFILTLLIFSTEEIIINGDAHPFNESLKRKIFIELRKIILCFIRALIFKSLLSAYLASIASHKFCKT